MIVEKARGGCRPENPNGKAPKNPEFFNGKPGKNRHTTRLT
jgi:hypothetical protein